MPEWLVERGIGETRAVRIVGGEIVEARIHLEDVAGAGAVFEARLKQAGVPALAVSGDQEFLLPKGAPGVTEGAKVTIEVTREAIPGAEPWKRALAKLAEGRPRDAPPLDAEILPFPSPDDRLEQARWSDLLEESRSGTVRFPGGELRVSPTPAMTLIDVDGHLAPFELALVGGRAAGQAIVRHSVGGSIGIDFPTVQGKDQRVAIGEAMDAVLPKPFERTAVNGFGFLQIVRPRRHASLFEIASDRPSFEARSLLRRAARETGAIRLVAHPAVTGVLEKRSDWLDALARQVGGRVSLRPEPSLPMSAAYAED